MSTTNRYGASRFSIADDTQVKKYSEQVAIVLGVLENDGALVTDLSDVGDFISSGDDDVDVTKLTELADIFGIPCSLDTKIFELARAITCEDITQEAVNRTLLESEDSK